MNVIRKLEIFLKIDFILSDIRLQSVLKEKIVVFGIGQTDILLFFNMSRTEGSTKELSSHMKIVQSIFPLSEKVVSQNNENESKSVK